MHIPKRDNALLYSCLSSHDNTHIFSVCMVSGELHTNDKSTEADNDQYHSHALMPNSSPCFFHIGMEEFYTKITIKLEFYTKITINEVHGCIL